MGMTQEQFAARFVFSVATLHHWKRRGSYSAWCIVCAAERNSACASATCHWSPAMHIFAGLPQVKYFKREADFIGFSIAKLSLWERKW
jgi:hypothetical protein